MESGWASCENSASAHEIPSAALRAGSSVRPKAVQFRMPGSLFLQPEQVVLQLGVAVLAGPEVEGSGGEFVDHGLGVAVFCEVDGLDVGLAGVAAFDANVVELAGRVDSQLLVVL